jgi:UDP-2-acetamido-3-amino-2,3-dideoxy-glucuronate N-acetyltransferase
MVFTNVHNPRAHILCMDKVRPTLVKTGASVGGNVTIICGNTVGRYAFIGAGAVVAKDVPDYALVQGNPARQAGWICPCGVKLGGSGFLCLRPAVCQEFKRHSPSFIFNSEASASTL